MIQISQIRYFSYSLSLILLGLLFGGIWYKKTLRDNAFLMGVEFSGGIQVECSIKPLSDTSNAIYAEDVKKILEESGYPSLSVRKLSGDVFIIRAPHSSAYKDVNILAKNIQGSLDGHFGSCVIRDSSFVGAGVGKQLAIKAIMAVLIAFLLMFFYIWLRFRSWAFSIANAISLGHDVLVIVLMILWFDYEVTLEIIGAILFIIGYSINDTIVLFSRIRENMRSGNLNSNGDVGYVISKSISEMLRRTLLTSFFTALVVVPLWLFGGANLEPLSAAVLLGIIFGTYSSIGIASPVLFDCLHIES